MLENESYDCSCNPYSYEDYCACGCSPEICRDEGCGCGCVEDDELLNCGDCCNVFNIFD